MKKNENIIYTKYSNDRAAPFRIATQIIECDGKKIVRKSAMEEVSRSHILAMKKHEAALNEIFVGTKFKANRIIASGDDFVDFEYLEGTSYDQILDVYLKNKDMDGFYSAANLFFEELEKLATAEFHANEMTNDVFGENVFTEGEKAIPVGDIDQIFQNVIVDSAGSWNVIDYEWTFDFAVPVRILKCRALLIYFFTSSARFPFFDQKSLAKFNISENDFELCKKIDQTTFTKYVQNKHSTLSDFTICMRKTIINPYVLEHQDFIDVFYDTGNGFSEAEKDRFYQFPFVVFTKENLRSIRIDPSDHFCIASDISIKADDVTVDFTTNAYMQKNGSYFFNTSDPQIYVEPPKEGVKSLYVDMLVSTINENTALEIEGQKSKIQEQNLKIQEQETAIKEQKAILDGCIADFQARIQQADAIIQKKKKEIDTIYSSRSWKLTKPLRACGKVVRKILR